MLAFKDWFGADRDLVAQAVERLEEIIKLCDAFMIARGVAREPVPQARFSPSAQPTPPRAKHQIADPISVRTV